MEDYVFKNRKKKEEDKPFYIIHQGFMYKLYKQNLSLNPPLLVNLLATISHKYPRTLAIKSHENP